MSATDGRPAGLSRGTEVRSRRAALKRAIKAGDADGLEVLAGRAPEWEEVAADMPVGALLAALPGVGPATVDQLLAERSIPAGTRMFGLTGERRAELADAIKRGDA